MLSRTMRLVEFSQKLWLALQEVDLSIAYRPGRKNQLADALYPSGVRCSVPKESLVASIMGPDDSAKSGEGGLAARQRGDPQLMPIIEYLETGALPAEAQELVLAKHQYSILDGILHYVGKNRIPRVIPPTEDRKSLFEEVHVGAFAGHLRESKNWRDASGGQE